MRISGVNVGKVKTKKPDNADRADRRPCWSWTSQYAPIPQGHARDPAPEDAAGRDLRGADARATATTPPLHDGGTLRTAQVAPTVELDEIFRAFDPKTRRAFSVMAGRPGTGCGEEREGS